MKNFEGDSHFNDKYGYGSSNLYDLKRVAKAFSSDDSYSEELRAASCDLINALSDAVIANFGGMDENGGLSIYFPKHALYYKVFEDGNLYFTNSAENYLKQYEENGFNEAYTELVKKLVFRDLVGAWLGKFLWQNEDDLYAERLLGAIEKNGLLQFIVDPSDIDMNDPEDPFVHTVQERIDERNKRGRQGVSGPYSFCVRSEVVYIERTDYQYVHHGDKR
jgi:hypothetical protein